MLAQIRVNLDITGGAIDTRTAFADVESAKLQENMLSLRKVI